MPLNLPPAPPIPDPNDTIDPTWQLALSRFPSIVRPSRHCGVCQLAQVAPAALGELEGLIRQHGDVPSAVTAAFQMNGILSALGHSPISDQQAARHLDEHVEAPQSSLTVRQAAELATPRAAGMDILVPIDGSSAAGRIHTALVQLDTVRQRVYDQFIDDPQPTYNKDGQQVAGPRLSAKEVTAYSQTVRTMQALVDSLERIRSGEQALQAAILDAIHAALEDVHIRVTEDLRVLSMRIEGQGMTPEQSAALLKEWLDPDAAKGLFTALLQAKARAFDITTMKHRISTGPGPK